MRIAPLLKVILVRSTAMLIAGCVATGRIRTKETIPTVRVMPNSSGIDVKAIQPHGPKNLLGAIDAGNDLPSGVSVSIGRIRPLHNTEPRYLIPAGGRLEVVSIERFADYSYYEQCLPIWKRLLSETVPAGEMRQILYKGQLTEIPWINAGRCFHAKARRREFPWGNAMLFLTTYVQGSTGGPVNNDALVLTVQGLTTDGRYAVNAHFEIRHSCLPESSWDKTKKGKAVFAIDTEDAKAEKWLGTQPDTSFRPTFREYETFLGSLRIESPSRN